MAPHISLLVQLPNSVTTCSVAHADHLMMGTSMQCPDVRKQGSTPPIAGHRMLDGAMSGSACTTTQGNVD